MNKAELTIQDIIHALFSHIIIILLVGALFGAGAWFYTSKYVPKMYKTSITFYAVSNTHQDTQGTITANEQSSNRQLASTYSYILKSNRVMKDASRRLKEKGVNIGYGSLKAMTTVATTNTEIFTATFVSSDQKNIKLIADTIAEAAIDGISEIVSNGEAKVLDSAEQPSAPYEPNPRAQAITFALVGLLLAGAIVVIRARTDTTVWSEEDLVKQYNIPVLGSIPQLAALEKSGSAKE